MQSLSERDISTKFVTPALQKAGWDVHVQIREEVTLTSGRIIVSQQHASRGKSKRADYVLYYKPNLPIAVIEVKDASHTVGAGMQQALEYAEMLDVPFVFSSNGKSLLFHDRTVGSGLIETEVSLDAFPSPGQLWDRFLNWKKLSATQERILTQPYYQSGTEKGPRYYQITAINRTIQAIAEGQQRILLVMATGTGKTYTAFQIIWRLWKSGTKKRILFLADRNILVDQARMNDFQPFGSAMTKISKRQVDKSFEIYLSLYQAVSGQDEAANIYKQFSPDFFDLIVVDECHRGSSAEDSDWREILTYFQSATQVGLTATPRETRDASNVEYFGDPVFTYSLRQGMEDGFLAPYRVVRYDLDKDLAGYRPESGTLDRYGETVEDRVYGQSDFDRTLVLHERTKLVATKVTEFLKRTGRFDKTIIFCGNQDHADRMRIEIANANADLVAENHRYVMRITSNDPAGVAELDNFTDPESRYPVVVTTSKLLSTGVDVKTCKLVVLDQVIKSMTEFKQIIGRGTRIDEAHGKRFFTIMDFRRATELFADPEFDGDPVQIYEPDADAPPLPADAIIDSDTLSGEPLDAQQDVNDIRPRQTYYLDNVPVQVVAKRYQYLDGAGNLINESLRSYTRTAVKAQFPSLEALRDEWMAIGSKASIIRRLEEVGVVLESLREELTGSEGWSVFDLLAYVAFDAKPIDRQMRIEALRHSNFFDKFDEKPRKVLIALAEKFVDDELAPFENAKILQLRPFAEIGTPVEIVRNIFGGKVAYEAALKQLQDAIFEKAV